MNIIRLHAVGATLAACLAMPSLLAAQVVQGRITDEASGTPIAGVDVSLLDSERGGVARTATDAEGHYTLNAPDTGDYYVVVDMIGYRRLESPLVALVADQTVSIGFELPADPIELEGLRVEADRLEEIKREVSMFGVRVDDLGERFVDAETIAKRPHARDFGLVLQWQSIPQLSIIRSEDGSNPGKPEVCVRISALRDACAVTVLNGARVTLETAASIPPEALDAIVVLDQYEAALLYGTDGGNGAVLLFTKVR